MVCGKKIPCQKCTGSVNHFGSSRFGGWAGSIALNIIAGYGDSYSNKENQSNALKQFDDDYGGFYVGHPIRTTSQLYHAWKKGPVNAQVAKRQPSWMGQRGFKKEFLEGDNPDSDQTHHFVAMFSAGINGAYISSSVWNLTDHPSDVKLTNEAYAIGKELAAHPENLGDIWNVIKAKICD